MKSIVTVAIAALIFLGAAGCATNEQLEALRQDVTAAQEMANKAMARADAAFELASEASAKADAASVDAKAAMSEAQAARTAAAAADAKAERIYLESLRK